MKKIILIVDEETREKVFNSLKNFFPNIVCLQDGEAIISFTKHISDEQWDFIIGFAAGVYYTITH